MLCLELGGCIFSRMGGRDSQHGKTKSVRNIEEERIGVYGYRFDVIVLGVWGEDTSCQKGAQSLLISLLVK